jgi:hypothetical protein
MACQDVVHIGCGQLGVGAVVPFLHTAFGESGRLFLVQRLGEKWNMFEEGGSCYLENDGGFFESYRVHVLRGPNHMRELRLELESGCGRFLLLVPNLSYLTYILDAIGTPETVISCSLGSGQGELVAPLRAAVNWGRLLAFENTMGDFNSIGKPVQHVLVDRICWGFRPPSEGVSHLSKRAHCEPDFSTFWVPADCGLSLKDTRRRAASYGFGSSFFVGQYTSLQELTLLKLRKRALINATHAILGMLCFRALSKRNMDPNRQYLAATQALLEKYFPEWDHALDVYCKMRAAEVASEEYPRGEDEQWQAKFFDNVAETRKAKERFLGTADLLERVVNAKMIRKELKKLKEHVLDPMALYEKNRGKLFARWRLGRPSDTEIAVLRDFLIETFASAIDWSESNRA